MPGPLHGYRIVDLSQIVSGPMATMLLSDQGADVVKVEPVDGQDVLRRPNFSRGGFSAFFLNNNRGKRSLAVDLQRTEGRQVILELVATADVFVQNFRPGVCDRMGLGYEDLRAVNPDLVYVSISGFGPTGPYADRPILDPVIQGLTGMVAYQVNPDIPFPDLVRNIVSDKSTALTVAQAITAALLARERGAGGQHVEVPMLDATLFFLWSDAMVDLTMVGDGVTPGLTLAEVYRLTECLDGKLVYFAASTAHIHGVSRAVGHPEWCEDPRYCLEGFAEDPQNLLDYGQMTAEAFASMSVADALAGAARGRRAQRSDPGEAGGAGRPAGPAQRIGRDLGASGGRHGPSGPARCPVLGDAGGDASSGIGQGAGTPTTSCVASDGRTPRSRPSALATSWPDPLVSVVP